MRNVSSTPHLLRDLRAYLLDIPSKRWAKLSAVGVFGANTGYLRYVEGVELLNSITNPFANIGNIDQYDRAHLRDVTGNVGILLNFGTLTACAGTAVGITQLIKRNSIIREAGRARIKLPEPVIIASCDGLAITATLGEALGGYRAANLVYFKAEEDPKLTAREARVFRRWFGVKGGIKRQFFDTQAWRLAGGKAASAVVLNASSTKSSIEAARVIRNKCDNQDAKILIVKGSRNERFTSEDLDAVNATLIDAYLELVERTVAAITKGNASYFIPVPDPEDSKEWHEYTRDKHVTLSASLRQLNLPSAKPVKMYLEGSNKTAEGAALRIAFAQSQSESVILTDFAADADVVVAFGDAELDDDLDVMGSLEQHADRKEAAIELRITFDRDNADNAFAHADGVVSIEGAAVETIVGHVRGDIRLVPSIGRLRQAAGAQEPMCL